MKKDTSVGIATILNIAISFISSVVIFAEAK